MLCKGSKKLDRLQHYSNSYEVLSGYYMYDVMCSDGLCYPKTHVHKGI